MESEKDLAAELLKQNGLRSATLSDSDRTRLKRMLAKEKARVHRMKWATAISWLLFLLCFPLAGIVVRLSPHGLPVSPWVWAFAPMAFFWIAVVCTVSLLLRWWSVGRREILAKLADLEAHLEGLQQDPPAEARDAARPKENPPGLQERPPPESGGPMSD